MRKHAMGSSLCVLGVCVSLLVTLGCSGSQEAKELGNKRYSLANVNAVYDKMGKTELSDLQDSLTGIINERLACYSSTVKTMERVRECRKKYVRSIVDLCRSRVKSAPQLGDSILCFQYCPISHAICKGDNIDCQETDCASTEARCIEYCLDLYWRGGAFPGGTLLP